MRRGFVTWRRTSVFLSSTWAMRHPSSRGAMPRTIVSTSGSSGTLDLAPGDVAPPGLALERNPLGAAAARLRRARHGVAKTGHTQHAAARGPQSALVVAVGPGVKNN